MNFALVKKDSECDIKRNNMLKMLSPEKNFKILLIKHYESLYQESENYFISIESQFLTSQSQPETKNCIRIKKIFTKEKQQNNISINQNKDQKSIESNDKILKGYLNKEQQNIVDPKRIISGNFIHQNAILVLKDPFEIYFLTQKSQDAIKIILQQPYQLQDIVAYFSFEATDPQKRKQPFLLTIYGYDHLSSQNKLFQVNLMTFQLRQIAQSKDYSPQPRKKCFKLFQDDRIYVFGGQKIGNKQIQELLWSFDLQKGYWFALEMNYKHLIHQIEKSISTMYDSGKVILNNNDVFYVLEIYQCKISTVQSISQENISQKMKEIVGMFSLKKKLYFYTSNQVLNECFTLQKHTISKKN